MNLILDRNFKNWTETTDGSGSVSVVDGVLTASGQLSDRAYLTSSRACNPGETYIFKCDAMVVSNNGTDPNPGMFIDHPSLPSSQNRVFFDSNQWKEYELKFTIPSDSDCSSDAMILGVGSWTSTDGEVRVANPRLESISQSPMSQAVWGQALFEISSSGALTIISQVNLTDAEWRPNHQGGESNLFVTFNGIPSGLNFPPTPRSFISTTSPASYIAKAPSTITGGSNGQFNVKILDTATGSYLTTNPSSTTRVHVEIVY